MLSLSWLLGITLSLSVLMILLILSFLLYKNQETQTAIIQELQKNQKELIQVAMSKDFMTFSALKSQDQTPSLPVEYVPGDDVSVANQLAENYRRMGLDPNSAYDTSDDLSELGLT